MGTWKWERKADKLSYLGAKDGSDVDAAESNIECFISISSALISSVLTSL